MKNQTEIMAQYGKLTVLYKTILFLQKEIKKEQKKLDKLKEEEKKLDKLKEEEKHG